MLSVLVYEHEQEHICCLMRIIKLYVSHPPRVLSYSDVAFLDPINFMPQGKLQINYSCYLRF